MKMYKIELENDNFEIIFADNDDEALKQCWELEAEGHDIFNVFEINKDYEVIRTVL